MAALHIVVVNLERRLGIDDGGLGEQQIPIHLSRVRFLRVGPNDDQTIEYTARLVVENSFEQLETVAARADMIDDGVIVDVLRLGENEEAVECQIRPLTSQCDVDFIANE